jgi:hypothetical protein
MTTALRRLISWVARERKQAAAAPAADGRPQEQPTRDEDDRDEYKVCVIGEKLHGKSAESERMRRALPLPY